MATLQELFDMRNKVAAAAIILLMCGTASALLSGYEHRAPIEINNTGNNLTDYQYNFTVDTAALVSAGKMQSDGADCRITDSSDTLISFWNETEFNSSTTKIFVNATSLGNVTNTTHYMYYGNAAASSVADITEMSIFGDDFESCSLGGDVYSVTKSLAANDGLGLYQHNGMTTIEKAIVTYNNSQYITYIKSNGRVIVGSRTLPAGAWSLYDTGHTIEDITDAHHTSSIAVDCDGYIHICYDEHIDVLRYRRSNASENINGFTVQSMTGANESQVTYPRFFMSNDTLFFAYRQGDSTTGDLYLNKYNNSTQTWSKLQHEWIDGGGKSIYMDNVATAANGDLHVSFVWRTYNVGQDIKHANYTHSYSDDLGETWRMENGTAYSMPITRAAAQCFDCAEDASLIAANHLDVDSSGNPHVTYWKNGTWQDAGGDYHLNYWHAWHNGTAWTVSQITNYTDSPSSPVYSFCEKDFARPGILINRTTDQVYIFGRKVADGYILVLNATSPYTAWSSFALGDDKWGWQEFGGFDYDEWHKSNVLYAMVTRNSIATPADIHVLNTTFMDLVPSSAQTLNTTKWTATQNSGTGGSWGVANSVLTMTQTPHADGKYYIYSNNNLSDPSIIEVRAKITQFDSTGQTIQDWGFFQYGDFNTNSTVFTTYRNEGTSYKQCRTWLSGSQTTVVYTPVPTTYHDWVIKWISGSSVKFVIDDDDIGNSTSNIPTLDMPASFFLRAYTTPNKNAEIVCDWIFVRKYAATEPTSSLGAEETLPNSIVIGANKYGMLRKNVSAAETFSTIAGGFTHDVSFTWWDDVTDSWLSYWVGDSYNSAQSIPEHESYFVLMDGTGETVSCSVAAAETVAIPIGWSLTYLRESTNKTLTSIKSDMGGNCTDLYAWNHTASGTGAWTDTGTYSVLPNQGLLVNASTGFNWDGAVP